MEVARQVGYLWRLREVMASRGLFSTTALAPLLAQRGIELSHVQVWRLVTGKPERLSLHVLAALCDILEVTPSDLIVPARTLPSHAQDPVQHLAAAGLFGGQRLHDPALLDEGGAIGHAQRHLMVLLGEQDGDAGPLQRPEQ